MPKKEGRNGKNRQEKESGGGAPRKGEEVHSPRGRRDREERCQVQVRRNGRPRGSTRGQPQARRPDGSRRHRSSARNGTEASCPRLRARREREGRPQRG